MEAFFEEEQSSLNKSKILIIDHELEVLDNLNKSLRNDFDLRVASTVQDGLNVIRNEIPDLILMDYTNENQSYQTFFEKIKSVSAYFQIPIILLSGNSEGQLRAEAIEAGADDFIAKPFFLGELVARIRRTIQRNETKRDGKQMKLGNLTISIDKNQAFLNGESIDLTILEVQLLSYLILNEGKLLSREQILERIWNRTKVSSRTVDTHISNLRKKLTQFNYQIRSRYGGGYIVESKQSRANLDIIGGDSHVRSADKNFTC